MNLVFFALIAAAFAVAAAAELGGRAGAMEALSVATIKAAEGAVPLALGLVGIMALFLGLMKVAEAGGLIASVARALSPLLGRLFPSVPAGHPALGAMAMNVSANLLGLGNAATPFGIRAMEQLDGLNPRRHVASNAQVMFLAINTAGVTLFPTKVVALRASLGSADPAAVVAPTLFATLVAAVAAVAAARWLGGRPDAGDAEAALPAPIGLAGWAPLLAVAAAVPLMVWQGKVLGPWLIPALVVGLLGFGIARRVPVYETFVEGAKEGFAVAVRIIPYLVAILVAVGMLRASGALDMALAPLGRLTAVAGLPAEALMMALMRTLSGSGAYGLLASYLQDPAIGPDSYTGLLLGTIYGSTETTFYVIAVYFGAVGIRRIRHALAAGLIADAAALVAAAAVCRLLV
ncbi:MAG: nucleoside recognition domain-containing protein [Actinomycetota bacterium]